MATTQSPISASAPRPAGRGRGRFAAWCHDHRRPLADVSSVQSPLVPGGRGQLSPGRQIGFIGFVVVQVDATVADLPASAVRRVIDTACGFPHPGLQVAVGGAPVEQVVSAAPGPAETIGLVAAVVVMLLAFGSVVAMALPILTALAGLGIGFGLLVALSPVSLYR
jgi:putative drug exporter of the RND superfamily